MDTLKEMQKLTKKVKDNRELKRIILMHKDVEVCLWESHNVTDVFSLLEIHDEKHMPIGVGNSTLMFEQWLKWRSIPYSRKNMKLILQNLNLQTTDFMIESCNGASLSDTYWYKKEGSDLTWDKINFYENDWYKEDSKLLFLQMRSGTSKQCLNTPDCVSIGNQPKAWIRENNINYLLKADKYPTAMEAFTEEAVSRIFRNMVVYRKVVEKDFVASKCKCFTTEDFDLVTANWYMRQFNYRNDTQYLFKLYETLNDTQKLIFIEMLVMDYIMLNSDRHLDNFGFLYWSDDNTPMNKIIFYDNGDSLARNIEPEKAFCYMLKNDTQEPDAILDVLKEMFRKGDKKPLIFGRKYLAVDIMMTLTELEHEYADLDISEYLNRKDRIIQEITRRCINIQNL